MQLSAVYLSRPGLLLEIGTGVGGHQQWPGVPGQGHCSKLCTLGEALTILAGVNIFQVSERGNCAFIGYETIKQ